MDTKSVPRSENASSSGSGGNDADFECNICFELAQDPIVTLCGHLYCWPCLYQWLHFHSRSQACPVCKAVIEEEKLVPLYGRGKTQSDPRSRSVPGVDVPNRPAGQRPETAPDANATGFAQHGFGFTGGFGPMGNINFSAAFGGLFPAFNFQMHGIPNGGNVNGGGAPGYPYGFHNAFHGGHTHGYPTQHGNQGQQDDNRLTTLLMVIGFLVIFALSSL
ncbi:hypothetical protein IFM89_018593 [Coptis chinensis]|uniref:E3 ubiquitin-protein ligase RMA n=1 Tax=Coptis chinensis TaxID=261450 RepID=A0A835I1Y3_9MAGN|nr:hypothetical protein IFM89_018593 [Coptis chinensis]